MRSEVAHSLEQNKITFNMLIIHFFYKHDLKYVYYTG